MSMKYRLHIHNRKRAKGSAPHNVHEQDRDRVWDLVENSRKGDPDAFAELYEHFADRVHRYIRGRSLGLVDPEDILADTFITAWQKLDSYRWTGATFISWLFAISHRHCQTKLRSAARKPTTHLEAVANLDSLPSMQVSDSFSTHQHDDLLEHIGRLPDEQQQVLILRFFCDLSVEETADALQRSAGAVRQLQFRALDRLRHSTRKEIA